MNNLLEENSESFKEVEPLRHGEIIIDIISSGDYRLLEIFYEYFLVFVVYLCRV